MKGVIQGTGYDNPSSSHGLSSLFSCCFKFLIFVLL